MNGHMEYGIYDYKREPQFNSPPKPTKWTCLNCGFYLDPVILKNKLAQNSKLNLQQQQRRITRVEKANRKVNRKTYIGKGLQPSDISPSGYNHQYRRTVYHKIDRYKFREESND